MGVASANADKQAGDARRFAAFISYSHADADAAAKLQRRLERYRLPRRIAETRAEKNAALGRIFRDREDFAAASNLSAAIREAISQAEAMVVICSPDAVASPWVAAEIELFRQLHPGRPLLAALLSGEPATSFPAALIADGNEPLAADLRPEGDGEQLGFLKIVAGIACVPLDELIQRDAQRRIRRVTFITGGALAAVLIMAIMTTLALQARNEAARQRAAAEGLVEYMLTDLRTKLKGVGRLDVMDAVNVRAMEHYRRQGDLADLPADSLERRARVLHAMGEDYEKEGNLGEAHSRFREAHRATKALLEQQPSNPDWLLAHAKSEYWLGFAEQKRANFPAAISAYSQYLNLSQQAVEHGLSPETGSREQGWAHNALGVVYFQHIDDEDAALQHFEKYRMMFAPIVAANSGDTEAVYSLADAYGWLADTRLARAELEAAEADRRSQIVFLDRLLADDPKNDRWLWSKIAAHRAMFRICYKRNDVQCARRSISSATTLLAERNFDPANRDWIWQSAYVALDRGFLEIRNGRLASAKKALAEGRGTATRYRLASDGDEAAIGELQATIDALSRKINEREKKDG